ncbi:MAG: hypothetical protein OQK09_16300 [Colwellia sp.]|nr:hypothetical protein [Colwellia sp.]
MSLNNDDLLNNVKRQAKRLSKKLSIPLGQSQEMLSYVVYGCDNYGQLISLLKSDSFENQNLILAGLHPNADVFLFKLLGTQMNNIVDRLEEKLANKKINEEIQNIIINIFAIEPTDFERKIN